MCFLCGGGTRPPSTERYCTSSARTKSHQLESERDDSVGWHSREAHARVEVPSSAQAIGPPPLTVAGSTVERWAPPSILGRWGRQLRPRRRQLGPRRRYFGSRRRLNVGTDGGGRPRRRDTAVGDDVQIHAQQGRLHGGRCAHGVVDVPGGGFPAHRSLEGQGGATCGGGGNQRGGGHDQKHSD